MIFTFILLGFELPRVNRAYQYHRKHQDEHRQSNHWQDVSQLFHTVAGCGPDGLDGSGSA